MFSITKLRWDSVVKLFFCYRKLSFISRILSHDIIMSKIKIWILLMWPLLIYILEMDNSWRIFFFFIASFSLMNNGGGYIKINFWISHSSIFCAREILLYLMSSSDYFSYDDGLLYSSKLKKKAGRFYSCSAGPWRIYETYVSFYAGLVDCGPYAKTMHMSTHLSFRD